MSDTPRDTPPQDDIATGGADVSGFGDLSGISEIFGLRESQQAGSASGARLVRPSDWRSFDLSSNASGTRTGSDTYGLWVAAPAGEPHAPADAASRLVRGRYRLIAELGTGGMGVTYRAWDTQVHVPVVVKMPRREVRRDKEAMARFAREIDAMRAVPHQAIVPITDSGDDDGCPFVVMRFLPGGSLADYRRWDEAGRPVKNPPGMLHFWLPGVAAALDHIHSRGMLHRDVKPGNIFLDGFLKPYLGDFGIAKVVDESGGLAKETTLTAMTMVVGTPEYMAPELFRPRSKPDGQADQYALAVTVYEMLSGEKPFKGDRAHIIVEHSGLPVPPLATKVPGLPQSLCMAVERALSKNAVERFPTCSRFAAAVLAELAMLPPEADTVRLLCPSCKNILKLSQRAAGKTGKCPRCQTAMDVAADLGSLWLESEERGGEIAELPQLAAAVKPLTEKVAVEKPRPRWGFKEWAAVAVAACCGLAVGYPWGVSVNAAKSRREFREAEAWRVERARLSKAEKVLVGQNSQLEAERNELRTTKEALAADNRRLGAALAAARAAKPAEPEESPAARPDLERMTNSFGMELIKLLQGEFMMGEGHTVRVTLSRDFWLGKTEVTRGQWEKVTGTTPWVGSGRHRQSDDYLPVTHISWDDAMEFCRKLTDRERSSGTLQANEVYRLPTEAEWEYACRAGTVTAYSFGDDGARLGDFAWFSRNAGGMTHQAGLRKANAWGFHDMHGNVWEWCSDWYDAKLTGGVDPVGPANGSLRVYRGGCLGSDPEGCRSAFRFGIGPSDRYVLLGFRVARSTAIQTQPSGIAASVAVPSTPSPTADSGRLAIAPVATESVGPPQEMMALAGVATLSLGDATLLVQQEIRNLDLDGITELSAEVAGVLASKKGGRLSLDGLKELRPEVAAALADYRGQLFLGGLASLPDETAVALGRFEGHLYLDGLTELSGTAAESIGWRGWLTLKSLPQLSAHAARGLAQRRGNINLRSVAALSDEAAAELERHQGWLILDGLQGVSTAVARSFAQHAGPIDLDGIKTLDDETAAALAQAKRRIRLNGLESLSQDAMTALRTNRLIEWSVNGVPAAGDPP